MKIISVPHPSLRQEAKPVKRVDQKLTRLVTALGDTLAKKKNPPGVGLAAPQVDRLWRVIATYLPPSGSDQEAPVIQVYINPEIVKHCRRSLTFGPDPEQPILEGCLSIPNLYGPVPRYRWVDVEYQVLSGDQLVNHKQRFAEFAGRVIQHEIDHLNGILFTDYLLKYDLPAYQGASRTEKLTELADRRVLETF